MQPLYLDRTYENLFFIIYVQKSKEKSKQKEKEKEKRKRKRKRKRNKRVASPNWESNPRSYVVQGENKVL